MIGEKDLCAMIGRLEAHMLRHWVDAGLLRSVGHGEPLQFEASDVARVRLICELHYDMDVEGETLPLVLSLMDQIYDLRRSARAVAAAIGDEPDDVRSRIAAAAMRRLRP
jgi:chaperone modulatory protein CbpM